jgi:phage terminase large subunit GpA-like protein
MVSQRLKVWRRQRPVEAAENLDADDQGRVEDRSGAQRQRPPALPSEVPACGDRFVPEWADVRWPDGKPEDAHLVRRAAARQVEHWQKAAMKLADGWLSKKSTARKPPRVLTEEAFQEWRAKMPASRKRGFHLTGIISSFQTWADMATSSSMPRAT